jgi:aminomethyltransferase
MGAFGGWDMPIQYAGILQEHHHTRASVSIFDICHMGEFELSGPTATQDLEMLLSCKVASMEIGQVRYGFMLNRKGDTIDDLTCYRLEPNRYMLVVNAGTAAKDADWIRANLSEPTVFSDLSAALGKIDVQGPEARAALEDVFGCALPDLGYFRFKEFDAGEAACILSRTGYTGEFGYELYVPVDAVVPLWNRFLLHEKIEPAGLGARDTLRLEMGYSLYGHELSEERTPVGTARGLFMDLSKTFIGKDAVLAELEHPSAYLVGLKFDSKRAAREHDHVFYDGRLVGEVTSGSVAPSLGVAVAMAFVRPEVSAVGTRLQVAIRGKHFSAEVVKLPFYVDGTARS